MRYRSLGSTNIKVSELGLGCSSLGNSVFNYGEEDEFLRVLDYAFESGINFFDTADTYTFGNSESLIGKAFKRKRDKVIISTKVGFLPSSLSTYAKSFVPFLGSSRKFIKPFKRSIKKISKKKQDFSSSHILQSIEKSLKRIRSDYIDIYLLHNPPSKILIEGEIFVLLDKLKVEGKIRFYGVSAGSIEDAVLCLNIPNVSVLQVKFNIIQSEAASKLFPFMGNIKKGIIARVPLARGLLTENGDIKTGFYSIEKDHDKAKLEILKRELDKINLREAAVRFILQYPEVSTLIIGTRSINHLKENLKLFESPSFMRNKFENIQPD